MLQRAASKLPHFISYYSPPVESRLLSQSLPELKTELISLYCSSDKVGFAMQTCELTICINTHLWAGLLSRHSDWLRAGRSGIESRWGRDFPPVQTGPGAHPASCKMGTGSFPGVKCGRGVLLTTHTLLVLRSWKSRAITLPTLWATPGL